MTFLELATAIDQAEAELNQSTEAVTAELVKLEKLKEKQREELQACEALVSTAKAFSAGKTFKLQALYSELQGKLPSAAPLRGQADPSSSDLKRLFQDGMQYRSKLG